MEREKAAEEARLAHEAAVAKGKAEEMARAEQQVAEAARKVEEAKKAEEERKAKALAEKAEEEKKKQAKLQIKKEQREARKSKRATVTGLSEEDQQRILLQLDNACASFDMDLLEASLNKAVEEGIEDKKVLTDANEMFQKLNKKDYVLAQLSTRSKDL